MGTRTRKSTTARKGRSRARSFATSLRSDPRLAELRKLSPGTRDRLHTRLYWMQTALITAILALENKGVTGEVSSSLRTHVYFPLRDITEALDAKGGQS